MFTTAWLRATLLALLAGAIDAVGQDGAPLATPVTVYTDFAGEYSAAVLGALKAQLTSIMGPIGLRFEWRDLKAARGNEVCAELVVVTFKGNCRIRTGVPGPPDSGPLGWTHMSDGVVLPFINVSCDRVRELIRPWIIRGALAEQEEVFGRALGRVMAHELYHVFADTTRHSARGIAKGFFTPNELVSDRFRFRTKEYELLRQGKLRYLFEPRTPGPTIAAGRH